jgi:hypothetical protein
LDLNYGCVGEGLKTLLEVVVVFNRRCRFRGDLEVGADGTHVVTNLLCFGSLLELGNDVLQQFLNVAAACTGGVVLEKVAAQSVHGLGCALACVLPFRGAFGCIDVPEEDFEVLQGSSTQIGVGLVIEHAEYGTSESHLVEPNGWAVERGSRVCGGDLGCLEDLVSCLHLDLGERLHELLGVGLRQDFGCELIQGKEGNARREQIFHLTNGVDVHVEFGQVEVAGLDDEVVVDKSSVAVATLKFCGDAVGFLIAVEEHGDSWGVDVAAGGEIDHVWDVLGSS